MTMVNILSVVIFSILAGVLATRVAKIIKHKKLVALRVNQALGLTSAGKENQESNSKQLINLALIAEHDNQSKISSYFRAPLWVVQMIERAALDISPLDLLMASLACALVPFLSAYICSVELLICLALGFVCLFLPLIALYVISSKRRVKFIDQLPDAIDLMVSVLRSGHSVSQAVRSVGIESAQPLGHEFEQILQRINLGQPFGDALSTTVAKYSSNELDLIRRAITIQAEVGGSLAELLDKTNLTLRQRLKLKRQVKVLTSQSKLTGIIVALLPILLACALNFLSPGYLEPLATNELGRMLLALAVVLELVGIVIINKMTEVKV